MIYANVFVVNLHRSWTLRMASLLCRSSARLSLVAERVLVQRAMLSTSVAVYERKYTKKHEWVDVHDGVGTIGITDFAAESLGDVVFVELPEEGREVEKGEAIGAVESVKAASDVYSPISGTVVEKNEVLEDDPGKINKSPFGDGWMYKLKVKNADELKELLSESQYAEFKSQEEAH